MAAANQRTVQVSVGQTVRLIFVGHPDIVVGHAQPLGEDRVMVATEAPAASDFVQVLFIEQDALAGTSRAGFLDRRDDEDRFFIKVDPVGKPALYLRVDGEFRRLALDMLEERVRNDPDFGDDPAEDSPAEKE